MNIDPTTYRFGVNKATLLNNNNNNNNNTLHSDQNNNSNSNNNGASSAFPLASRAVNDDLILVPKLVCDYYKTTSSEIGKGKPGVICNVNSADNTVYQPQS